MRDGPILQSGMQYVHVLFFLQDYFHLLFHLGHPSYESGIGVPTKVEAVLIQSEF